MARRRLTMVGKFKTAPEIPVPARGEAGLASSLVTTWGLGPPERRSRSEIPDLIAINSHGGPRNPGDRRAAGCRIELPGKFGSGSRISLFSAIMPACNIGCFYMEA